MWPFVKRRKSRVAFYDDGILTVNLQVPLQEPDVFTANCHNYALALQQRSTFTEITGQNIDLNWRHGDSRRAWGQRRARLEAQNFVDAFAIVVQGAAQGIQTAASIKILSSD